MVHTTRRQREERARDAERPADQTRPPTLARLHSDPLPAPRPVSQERLIDMLHHKETI